MRLSLANKADVTGKTILLVDDVMTSGATVSELAKCFKKAKAKSVYVAVVARGAGVIAVSKASIFSTTGTVARPSDIGPKNKFILSAMAPSSARASWLTAKSRFEMSMNRFEQNFLSRKDRKAILRH